MKLIQIKRSLKILFCSLLLVVIICSVASIPVSALYGYIGGETDDPVLFHPQINVEDIGNDPETNLIHPTIAFINYNGSTSSSWNQVANGSIITTRYTEDDDPTYEWYTLSTWRQTTSATTGLAVAATRFRFSNSVSNVNSYDITLYQDVIYLPFKYVDPSNGGYDQGIVDAWFDFYVSITGTPQSATVNIQDVNIDYSVYAPQMVSTSSQSGGTLTATDVKLFDVQDLTDFRYLFPLSLYEDICEAMRDERDMRQTSWIAIRDFEVTFRCGINSPNSGPESTRIYIDLFQPLNVAKGDGTYQDLTSFRSDDYFSHLKGYYTNEGGGTPPPVVDDSGFVDWIVNVLDAFFGVQLFGSFGLGDLMWFVVGIGVLFAVLKIFAGG